MERNRDPMPSSSRRNALALIGSTMIGVAGCIGTPDGNASGDPPFGSTGSDPIRAEGHPITVEAVVEDEPGYDDEIEYVPENRTVRVVTRISRGEPAEFEQWDFEAWASVEAAEVARPRAVEVTAERLDTDDFGSGVGRLPDVADTDESIIYLYLTTLVDEDEEVVRTPTRTLDGLVSSAPRTVESTVTIQDHSHTREVPVFADHRQRGPLGGG